MLNGEGSAYGFRLHSAYPLRFLRQGGGVELLHVAPAAAQPQAPQGAPVFAWTYQVRGQDAQARLYGSDDRFELHTSGGAAWQIDPGSRTVRIANPEDERFWEPGLWGIPALLCFMQRGDLPLHAAAIEVNGEAVLLGAPGRSGKTTLALAFHRHGYRLLTEDLACCRLTPGPVLLPGPAFLRVRPDMYDGAAPAGTHVVATRTDRIYLGVNEACRGTGEPVPISTIVFLRECDSGVRLERMTAQRALSGLWPLSFRLPTRAAQARCLRQLSALVGTVPVWSLHRPLQRGSLDATVAGILEVCGA